MSRKTDTVGVRTIGIDTGKNTVHVVGLDDSGEIVLRDKLPCDRAASRPANMPPFLFKPLIILPPTRRTWPQSR